MCRCIACLHLPQTLWRLSNQREHDVTIAIVGQACLLPGAATPQQLWQLVQRQHSALTPLPPGRFGMDADSLLATPGHAVDKAVSAMGGYVQDPSFDAHGLAPVEADWQQLDPLFRWVVSTARDAARDAGLPDRLAGKRVRAVFGNLSFPTEAMTRIGAQRAFDPQAPSSITDAWNLRMSGGPALLLAQAIELDHAVALDAACASSLYAMHLGCQWLRDQRCDVVLAGAVNRADRLFLHVGFTALQALSPSGRSRPFSVTADGLLPAEGCAFIAMMRLEDAIAQGKRVLAVVRGSALSNDGRQRNLLTPSSEGQVRAILAAWNQAQLDPSLCQYVECHATGTQAGDATEVNSMATALSHGRTEALPVSSLKANLGHLITVAGMAGVVKTIAGMQTGELPAAMPVEELLPIMEQHRLRLSGAHETW
jgi:acyl transferase domain-containing protein